MIMIIIAHDIDEAKHPVIDEMPAIDAGHQIAAGFFKAVLQLGARRRSGGAGEKGTAASVQQSALRVVDAAFRWIGARVNNHIAFAVSNLITGIGSQVGGVANTCATLAKISFNVLPGGVSADRINRQPMPAAVHQESDGTAFLDSHFAWENLVDIGWRWGRQGQRVAEVYAAIAWVIVLFIRPCERWQCQQDG